MTPPRRYPPVQDLVIQRMHEAVAPRHRIGRDVQKTDDLLKRVLVPDLEHDRFPLFQLLINQAVTQGNVDATLDYLNDGERDDCENNEGKRRNEYELRRAQVHAKRGEFDDAERVYDSLISRVPTELNYRVNAAETMLSARQGAKAAKYAKEGLAAALKANNRDLEGHFKELMAAAQK